MRNILFEADTPFNSIAVVEEDNVRRLLFSKDKRSYTNVQGALFLDDPDRPIAYCQAMLAAARFHRPKNALVIGLGIGFLPNALKKYLDCDVSIVEIDPQIVKTAENYFYFSPDDYKIYLGEASQIITKIEGKFDHIYVDAFSSNYIPFHLMCAEFLSSLKELSSGLVVFNTGSEHPSFGHHVCTINHVFKSDLYEWKIENTTAVMSGIDNPAPIYQLPEEYYPQVSPKKISIPPDSKVLRLYAV